MSNELSGIENSFGATNYIEKSQSNPISDGIDIRMPTINLAIGPSCPVRCEGCHNYFGDTFRNDNLISADEVLDFAESAQAVGVNRAVVSGGDPLTHPEIEKICTGLHDVLKYFGRIDTGGTSFLDQEANVIFKGRGLLPRHNIEDLAPHVSRLHVPLDGVSQDTVSQFRTGRPNLFNETLEVVDKLRGADVEFGINTVANEANINDLPAMYEIIKQMGATEWRIFEYEADGPNPSSRCDTLVLEDGKFEDITKDFLLKKGPLKVVVAPLAVRRRRCAEYLMINDAGIAYRRRSEQIPTVLGHIVCNRSRVIGGLREYIENFVEEPITF
jgi:MoaA/NifB/PqqE/SkfB family radical SAM enzyme